MAEFHRGGVGGECVINNIDFQKAAGTQTIVAERQSQLLGINLTQFWLYLTDIFITIHIKLVQFSRISVLIQSAEVSQPGWETKKRTQPTLDFLS